MTKSRLIIYSLVLVLLAGIAIYRSSTGPDPGPPPEVKIELPKDGGATPSKVNDPEGSRQKQADFDGDEPRRIAYSFDFDVKPIMTARCFGCHAKKDKVGGEYHFYDYESVMRHVKDGDLSSPISAAVAQNGKMKKHIGDAEANILREWVLLGAKP